MLYKILEETTRQFITRILKDAIETVVMTTASTAATIMISKILEGREEIHLHFENDADGEGEEEGEEEEEVPEPEPEPEPGRRKYKRKPKGD
jgi:hypothetical protein